MEREEQVRHRVLVVEDDCAASYALARMLKHLGYEVECVETVRAAVDALGGRDAVILDLNLPDGLGTAVLSRVRTLRLPHKVLVLSATADPRLLDEVAALRPDGVLRKPVGIEQIKGWLDAHLLRPGATQKCTPGTRR
jgi:DNA-binding response OmpR family regulator